MPAPIRDVSDTALWVAVYRARESTRADALFKDVFAERLAGERGVRIAAHIPESRYTEWNVVVRTVIIDTFIQNLVKQGVDLVLNLGAGLDARPYRMDLPSSLRWIEVDYPHMIEHKAKLLSNEVPKCQLERVGLDLANAAERAALFAGVNSGAKKVLVLTEGVIPYLSNEEAASLANDLAKCPNFTFWILDYISPRVTKYLQSKRRLKVMKNAPFKFAPKDWFEFFAHEGWKVYEPHYLADVSIRLGRPIPHPWWVGLLQLFTSKKQREEGRKFTGYFVMERK